MPRRIALQRNKLAPAREYGEAPENCVSFAGVPQNRPGRKSPGISPGFTPGLGSGDTPHYIMPSKNSMALLPGVRVTTAFFQELV